MKKSKFAKIRKFWFFSSKFFYWKNQNFQIFENFAFFRIKNLKDEKIFLVQIFFCVKIYISAILKIHLEHPDMHLDHARRPPEKNRSFFVLNDMKIVYTISGWRIHCVVHRVDTVNTSVLRNQSCRCRIQFVSLWNNLDYVW